LFTVNASKPWPPHRDIKLKNYLCSLILKKTNAFFFFVHIETIFTSLYTGIKYNNKRFLKIYIYIY
jgi:hypothetical protein